MTDVRVLIVGLETVSEPNARGHWGKLAELTARQRQAAYDALMPTEAWLLDPRRGLCVTLIAQRPRKLDSDNLVAALKYVRDGVADFFGVDDGRDDVYTWDYRQRRGPFAVEIWVSERVGEDKCPTDLKNSESKILMTARPLQRSIVR